jgi:hypothetical protein
VFASPAAAQQLPRLPLLPESRVWVDGTSNKNDWTVKATDLSGFVHLRVQGDAIEFGGGSFTVGSKKLVSEHGVIMTIDANAPRAGHEHRSSCERSASAAGGGKYAVYAGHTIAG